MRGSVRLAAMAKSEATEPANDDSDIAEALAAFLSKLLRPKPQQESESIEPAIERLTDAVTGLCTHIESLPRPAEPKEAAPPPDIAAAMVPAMKSILGKMAADIAAMKTAATAKRHIVTDVNGEPIGIRIGD